MTRLTYVHPHACHDVDRIVASYDQRRPGVSGHFLADLCHARARVEKFPDAYSQLRAGLRRAPLSQFPYTLVYQADNAKVVVYAILYDRRGPSPWCEQTSRQ